MHSFLLKSSITNYNNDVTIKVHYWWRAVFPICCGLFLCILFLIPTLLDDTRSTLLSWHVAAGICLATSVLFAMRGFDRDIAVYNALRGTLTIQRRRYLVTSVSIHELCTVEAWKCSISLVGAGAGYAVRNGYGLAIVTLDGSICCWLALSRQREAVESCARRLVALTVADKYDTVYQLRAEPVVA